MFKKSVVFVAFLAFVSVACQSQAQVELKPAIGLTYSGVSNDPQGGNANWQVGWQLGGTVAYGKKWYGEAGAFYAWRSTEFTSSTPAYNFDLGIDGVRIPVMGGYHVWGHESGMFGLRAFGGGALFIVTSVDAPGLSKSDFESPTFGLFVGLGADISLVFVDVKYEWSLTDVSSINTIDIGKGRSLYINAGVRVPL